MTAGMTLPLLQLLASAVPTPVLATGSGPDVAIWRVMLSLLFCLALAGAAIWLLRQRMGGNLPNLFQRPVQARLRLVERISLGQQTSAALVELDGRELLIVSSPNAVTVVPVDQKPVPQEEAE